MSTLKRFEPMLQPWIFFSRRNMGPSSSIFWPTGIMPTMVAVPPGPDAVEALLGRELEADALEGVVHAAVGHRADLLDRIVGLGVDPVRGAELLGRGELGLDGVHRDDHARARDARALDRGEAHAAGAEDRDGRARLDARGVQHRAHARW